MSAIKKRLQKEPAFPNGSPAGRSIMRACQIATQACDLRPRSVPTVMVRGDPPVRCANTASISGSITSEARRSGSSRAQARTCNKRTASGDNRPSKRIRPSTLCNCRSSMRQPLLRHRWIVLHQPSMSIPLDPLPGLYKRGGGHRGHQDPFQWLRAFGSLLFPDPNDPYCQGVLARSRLMAWWQKRQLPTGKLQLGRTCLVPVSGGNLERMARLARPGSCLRQRIADLCFAFLHAP